MKPTALKLSTENVWLPSHILRRVVNNNHYKTSSDFLDEVSETIDQMPWNKDDILNEDHRKICCYRIYNHFKFNRRDEFPTSDLTDRTPNHDRQVPCYIFDQRFKSKMRPLKEMEAELLEDYKEYKGELPDGNIIKKQLCKELNYLLHVIKSSNIALDLQNYLTKAYRAYPLDQKTAIDSANYEEIHKKVTAWVDQDPNTYGGDEEKNRYTFQKLIESSLPEHKDLYDIKQAKSDMSEGIDYLLEFLHKHFDNHKSDVKKYKIWTLDGFFRFFNDINLWNHLNLKTQLNSVLKPIVYQLMKNICVREANTLRIRVIGWASLYPTNKWSIIGGPERDIRTGLKIYWPGIMVHPEILDKFHDFLFGDMDEIKDPLTKIVPLTSEFKQKHRAESIEILSTLLTESSNQFQVRRRKQEEEISTIVSENFYMDVKPDVEEVDDSEI